jgi:FKBP-type peptidyl-prolyl cis-trans isomerase FkpA
VAAVALFSALAGCADLPASPSNPAFSQTDLRAGTGATAVTGSLVAVHYTGWLFDASAPDQKGPVFETSLAGAPFAFVLGTGAVIRGWDQGVPGMREGGLRRFIIPPDLAYGDTRAGIIPPNATLVFEIDLLAVE